MKSAYERALERFGTESIKKLSAEQKERIADLERRRQAQLAEAEMAYHKRQDDNRQDPEKLAQIIQDYQVEVASIESRAERAKEKIRNET